MLDFRGIDRVILPGRRFESGLWFPVHRRAQASRSMLGRLRTLKRRPWSIPALVVSDLVSRPGCMASSNRFGPWVLDFLHLGSSLSPRSFGKLGSSVSAHGVARSGSVFST